MQFWCMIGSIANAMPIHKKDWKKVPGNYKHVSLTSVLGKDMEQIILSAIYWHIQDNQDPAQSAWVDKRPVVPD